MKRFTSFALFAAALTALVGGCTFNETTNSSEPEGYNLRLEAPSYLYRNPPLPEGERILIPVTAILYKGRSGDAPVVGKSVQFWLESAAGTMTPASVVTDAAGIARSSASFRVDRNTDYVYLYASVADLATESVHLYFDVTGRPAEVNVRIPPVIYAKQDEAVEIEFEAQVVDSAGKILDDVPISCGLEAVGATPTFGAVNGPSRSGRSGEAKFTFDSQGGFGAQKIFVATDYRGIDSPPVRGEASFEVKPLSALAGSIRMNLSPNRLAASPDSLKTAQVVAQVTSPQNDPVVGIYVRFSTNLGSISRAGVTDALGVARGIFTNNFQSGSATIYAWVPGTNLTASDTLVIEAGLTSPGRLTLATDRDFIYVTRGVHFANLTASLRTADGAAISNAEIRFSTSHGAVSPRAVTDANGIARATFTDVGLPSLDQRGNPVPATITALFPQQNITAATLVTIRPEQAISHITLTSNRNMLVAGEDTARLRATVVLENGDFAPAGTMVWFGQSIPGGSFGEIGAATGQFGVAENSFAAGGVSGLDTLTAFTGLEMAAAVVKPPGADDEIVRSNDLLMTIAAGSPTRISVTADPALISGDDPNARGEISALVADAFGNPVRQGALVRFRASSGLITPTAITNANGEAVAEFNPFGVAGNVTITASLETGGSLIEGTTTLYVSSGLPDRIELSFDPPAIPPALPGWVGSAGTATVFDRSGNLVSDGTVVVFQLLNNPPPPQGVNINNHGDIDSARTVNGLVVVSVNAGQEIGVYQVRAYTWRDPDSAHAGVDNRPRTDTVSTVGSISVIGGGPFRMSVAFDRRGVDAGGGTWELEVSAHVWDVHRNPVADEIPVIFTVDPQVAVIDPGYTGNENRNGETSPGVAYSMLRYHSLNTFSPITISAEIVVPAGSIVADLATVLPLQRGRVLLNVDPESWMMDRDRPNDSCLIRVWATVLDGHDVSINDAPVIFTTSRGRLYWKNLRLNGRYIPFFPEVVRRFTGLVNQENNEPRGVATVYLRAPMEDIFLDPFTLEYTVRVNAQVEGYDDAVADPVSIFFTRH